MATVGGRIEADYVLPEVLGVDPGVNNLAVTIPAESIYGITRGGGSIPLAVSTLATFRPNEFRR